MFTTSCQPLRLFSLLRHAAAIITITITYAMPFTHTDTAMMRRDDAMLILLRHASHTPLCDMLAPPTLLRRQLAITSGHYLRAIFH
jgi:hypothetical protein